MYITTYTARKGHEYYEYIPTAVSDALKKADKNELRKICEIRLKNEDAVSVTSDCVRFLNADGTFSDSPKNAIHISSGVLLNTLERMCQSSVYAAQSELRNGFLTLPGGHRVGVCGKVNVENGKIISLTEISGLNFRIAGEVKGAADFIMPYIKGEDKLLNTLVISPPACGKTTVLRDIARQLGGDMRMRVGIVDERGEIAAMQGGKAQYDIGFLTQVYTGCPKADGMLMMLRGLSPDVIITDEIGTREDEEAIFAIINSGVKIICSIHGYDLEDVKRRGLINELTEAEVFERKIILSRKEGPGTVEKIY